ncbi:hypothetical protein [Paenarthrobacter aromaticivorans]|uniref:Uncharacterized protein n=1 Tax=Paenarthrobacter aromaticivorans TaxID=2849150 RepID=A0ABS6I4J4_9MICC|nr:hypothetical protein [Paenarthrobacter sp. MMS21-TAE1-1]MBU8866630.1 hypothetical protein [Paenarthrobacter sp. MMS21-TAE1-1]
MSGSFPAARRHPGDRIMSRLTHEPQRGNGHRSRSTTATALALSRRIRGLEPYEGPAGALLPAARFACKPLLSGTEGGHEIHLRELGRRGMHLHRHMENIDDGDITFSDDLPERPATVESRFNPDAESH